MNKIKGTELRQFMNKRFIEAVDLIFKGEKEAGTQLYTNDTTISNIIYTKNRGLVNAVRSGTKHVPISALDEFVKHFGMPMDLFFNKSVTWEYKGMVMGSGDSASKESDNIVSSGVQHTKSLKEGNTETNTILQKQLKEYQDIIAVKNVELEKLHQKTTALYEEINKLNQLLLEAKNETISAKDSENSILKKYLK